MLRRTREERSYGYPNLERSLQQARIGFDNCSGKIEELATISVVVFFANPETEPVARKKNSFVTQIANRISSHECVLESHLAPSGQRIDVKSLQIKAVQQLGIVTSDVQIANQNQVVIRHCARFVRVGLLRTRAAVQIVVSFDTTSKDVNDSAKLSVVEHLDREGAIELPAGTQILGGEVTTLTCSPEMSGVFG